MNVFHRKVMTFSALAIIGSGIFSCCLAEERSAWQVFKKWQKHQRVYEDINFSHLADGIDESFGLMFKNQLDHCYPSVQSLWPFLFHMTQHQVNEFGYLFDEKTHPAFASLMGDFYTSFDGDISLFIDYLVKNQFSLSYINAQEERGDFNRTIEKYKNFSMLLFPQLTGFDLSQALFAFANRLFEYSFEEKTCEHHKHLLQQASQYSVARFIHAILWSALVGEGWKHWHESCLKSLKEHADAGKEIVYVAGGSDIYELLKHGIYNVTVIDPFLPTQERFYSEGWLWLVRTDGQDYGVGDIVRIDAGDKKIMLRRDHCEIGEKFYYYGSNKKVLEIEKNITRWGVYAASGEKLGNIEFQRRPVVNEDFKDTSSKAIVMSYDELVCVAAPDVAKGWGIDMNVMNDDIVVYVKQLRKPIIKNTLQNIRVTSLLMVSDLKFINLVSDPT